MYINDESPFDERIPKYAVFFVDVCVCTYIVPSSTIYLCGFILVRDPCRNSWIPYLSLSFHFLLVSWSQSSS